MKNNRLHSYIRPSVLFAVSLVVFGCQTQTELLHYAPQKMTGLKTPESVVQAKDGRIFVSEIGEFGKDGDGQITILNRDGKRSVFATGLDDPKGLAMIGKDLYVADKTRVWKINAKGKASVFAAPSAFPTTPLFLNDLEADPQGNLYVSDSGDLFNTLKGGAIYKISANGAVQLLVNDAKDTRIKSPNGLLADDTGTVLLEVDFASGVLYSLNLKTGAMTDVAEGFGGGDGVVHHSNGTMYVSDWKGGKVYSVDTKGEMRLIRQGYQSAADIAITKDERYLLVPDMKAGELDFIPLQ